MLYLLAASLLWAFSFGLIKGQLSAYDPVLVACGRLLLAALVFLPFCLKKRFGAALAARAAGLGVIQFGLMYTLYIASFAWLPAWQVALLTVFTPLYVALLSDLTTRRFVAAHWIGAAIAVGGAALVLRTSLSGADWRGVLFLQGANLCFAWGQLRFRTLAGAANGREAALLGWMYAGAAGATLVALLVKGPGVVAGLAAWPASAWWSWVYLGVLPTGLGFYLWNRGAVRTAAGQLAVANNLKVPLAILVSALVFGESAPWGRVLAGLGLIGLGLYLAWTNEAPPGQSAAES